MDKMISIKLIDGRFNAAEAESLLSDLVKAKISFNHNRINTVHHSEEEIKHAEKRILELEESLRNLQSVFQTSGEQEVDIEAVINIKQIDRVPS